MKFYIILLITLCFFSILGADSELAKNKKIVDTMDKCKLDRVSKSNKEKAYFSFKKARTLITKSQNKPFSPEFREGLVCLHTAVNLEPTKAKYIAFLGDSYNILGLSNVPNAKIIAFDLYDDAIGLDDSLNEVRIKAGILAINSGLYMESLDYLEGALQNNVMYFQPNILGWMNIAYVTLPQTQRGVEFYTKLLKQYPQADILKIYQAILLKTQQNSKAAGKVLLEVISNPNSNKESVDMAYKLLAEVK